MPLFLNKDAGKCREKPTPKLTPDHRNWSPKPSASSWSPVITPRPDKQAQPVDRVTNPRRVGFPRRQEPRGIEDECQLRGHVDEGGKEWIERAERRESHTYTIEQQCGVLGTPPIRYLQQQDVVGCGGPQPAERPAGIKRAD